MGLIHDFVKVKRHKFSETRLFLKILLEVIKECVLNHGDSLWLLKLKEILSYDEN